MAFLQHIEQGVPYSLQIIKKITELVFKQQTSQGKYNLLILERDDDLPQKYGT